MAGTAAEQAIGMSKPVVQLVGNGPQFTASFAEAQRRLLGSNIFCAKGSVEEDKYMLETCNLTLDLLEISYRNSLLKVKDKKDIPIKKKVEGVSGLIAKSITNSFLNC